MCVEESSHLLPESPTVVIFVHFQRIMAAISAHIGCEMNFQTDVWLTFYETSQ